MQFVENLEKKIFSMSLKLSQKLKKMEKESLELLLEFM